MVTPVAKTRSSVTGRWAGVPADERRAERRRLLVDAAFDLLGTEGTGGTTVRAVCQAARLNPRYFYESFEDLDALLVAVYDRVVGELGATAIAAVEAARGEPAAEIRAGIGAVVGFVTGDPRRARVLYVESLGNPVLAARGRVAGQQLLDLIEASGRERHGSPPPGEHIGSMAAALLVGGLGALLLAWMDGRLAITEEQLVEDATALFLGTLGAAATVAERRNPTRVGSRLG
jgi:AcrR family transcriptional regulator